MQRLVHAPAMRRLALLASGALALALAAQPAAASNRSIFKTTQTYVGKAAPHQNAFDDKFTARDYRGSRTEVAFIASNAVAAMIDLTKQKPSDARGAKGKRLLLRYWSLKQAATAELGRAVEASASGDAATAKRHLARYDTVANKAVGLLFVGLRYLE
jgi:hypothetical protein